MSDAYLEGVVGFGDDVSKVLHVAGTHTYDTRAGRYGEVIPLSGHFRGTRVWSIAPLLELEDPAGIVFGQDTDGIGTKVLINQRMASYETAGMDLLAMAADDPAAKGLVPTALTTVLNVNRLKDEFMPHIEQLGRGIIAACTRAQMALLGGETAIMGDIIQGYGDPEKVLWFEMSGTVHAIGHKERIINPANIKPGMSLVGFADPGFRSNGITGVRETFERHLGKNWHNAIVEFGEGPQRLGDVALRPSVIFTPVLVAATGGYDLSIEPQADLQGVAHITGGGFTKLADLLSESGYGADIEGPLPPPPAMRFLQRLGSTPDEVMYGKVHMGQAMISATPNPNQLIALARAYGVEAAEIGTVTKERGIKIRSAGTEKPGQTINFPIAA